MNKLLTSTRIPHTGRGRPLVSELSFNINPWRQKFHGDAMVKVSEIVLAEFIRQGSDTSPNNWFQVRTKDGRFIQSELYGKDRNILAIMNAMQAVGAKIYVRNYQCSSL